MNEHFLPPHPLPLSYSMRWGGPFCMSLWLPSILCKFRAFTWGAYAYWKGGTTQGRHRWSHPPCQDADNGKWKWKLKPCIQLHLARTKGACRRQGTRDKASEGVEEHVSGHKRPSSAGLSITEVIETCWHCARHPSFFFLCFKLPVTLPDELCRVIIEFLYLFLMPGLRAQFLS